MRLKVISRVWIGLATITAVAIAIFALHQHLFARSAEPPFPPPPSPATAFEAREYVSGRGERWLELAAPPYDRVSLGPGTRAVYYRTNAVIEGGYVTSNGLLYVTTLKADPVGGPEYWSLGLLNAGQIQPILLPTRSGYSSIDFSEASTAVSPVISASDYDGRNSLFALYPQGVSLLPYRVLKGTLQNAMLSTGERCYQPPTYQPNNTPYDLFAVDAFGRQRPILAKAELLSATRGAFRELTFVSLSCHNFNGQDYIGVNSDGEGVVYRLTGGRLTLVTRGTIVAAAQSRMLIRYQVVGPQKEATGYFDYLEAFARPNPVHRM